MRAKTVNEDNNFERGKNPKAAIGIGGINLSEIYQEKMDDLFNEIAMTKFHANEEWSEFLTKTFVGKKITAHMTRMVTFNLKTKERSLDGQKSGEFTIEVQDIKPSEDFSDFIGRNVNIAPQVIVADTDNKMYTMRLGQKIFIE
jgi:hypothetical protein